MGERIVNEIYNILAYNNINIKIDLSNCSIEELKRFKHSISSLLHLDKNLDKSKIERDKLSNTLKVINDKLNELEQYINDYLKFREKVRNIAKKYENYGDYALLKNKIEEIVNKYIDATYPFNNDSLIEEHLDFSIFKLYDKHFIEKIKNDINEFKKYPHYNQIKGMINRNIRELKSKLYKNKYNGYYELITELKNNLKLYLNNLDKKFDLTHNSGIYLGNNLEENNSGIYYFDKRDNKLYNILIYEYDKNYEFNAYEISVENIGKLNLVPFEVALDNYNSKEYYGKNNGRCESFFKCMVNDKDIFICFAKSFNGNNGYCLRDQDYFENAYSFRTNVSLDNFNGIISGISNFCKKTIDNTNNYSNINIKRRINL